MLFPRAFLSTLSAMLWVALPVAGQSVVSTHAGVVHYFEGTVAIGGEPLQPQFGRFPEIPEGAELRTAQGRAEVLMGPGVMLRVAEDTAVKMVSSRLADVRLELLAGSAILQSKEAQPGNSVTVRYKEWQVQIPKQGVYRIDSNPEQLRAYDGEVEVRAGEGTPVTVKAGQTLPFGPVLMPDQTLGPPGDEFNNWAFDRTEAIDADNATAAQIVDDPALYPNLIDASGLAMAGYTYFPPTLGYPYMSYGTYGPGTYGPGTYGTWNPYIGSYGYGYSLGPSYMMRYLGPGGLPGRITMPSLPIRMPTAGGYHPGMVFPTTRPGIGAPSIPHPAAGAHPVVHGGRH